MINIFLYGIYDLKGIPAFDIGLFRLARCYCRCLRTQTCDVMSGTAGSVI